MLHGVRAALPGNHEVNFAYVPWSFLETQSVTPDREKQVLAAWRASRR
jgi:hypothetical protein